MTEYRTTVRSFILENLINQRKTGELCDMCIILGKEYFWIHSSIACTVSSYIFKEFLKSTNNIHALKSKEKLHDNRFVKIKLNGKVHCTECLESVFNFMYGGEIIIKNDHKQHLLYYCEILDICDGLLNILYPVINVNKNDIEISSIKLEENFNKTIHPSEENFDSDTHETIDSHVSLNLKLEQDGPQSQHTDGYNDYNVSTGKTQKCLECSFTCLKSSDLLKHVRQLAHIGNVCSLCLIKVNDSQDLNKHYDLHDNPKPFFCTFCNLRFRSRSQLGQHFPSHMIKKSYICSYCSKSFKRKNGLKSHLVTHSRDTKHLCDECGFTTIYARILRAHKLTHSGNLFKCSFPGCEQTSTRKENMKQHFGTHNNEKKFVCEQCGQKFTQSKSLTRHSLIHSQNNMNNICSQCPFKARRLDNLKAHIQRQHNSYSNIKDP